MAIVVCPLFHRRKLRSNQVCIQILVMSYWVKEFTVTMLRDKYDKCLEPACYLIKNARLADKRLAHWVSLGISLIW